MSLWCMRGAACSPPDWPLQVQFQLLLCHACQPHESFSSSRAAQSKHMEDIKEEGGGGGCFIWNLPIALLKRINRDLGREKEEEENVQKRVH